MSVCEGLELEDIFWCQEITGLDACVVNLRNVNQVVD